MPDNENDSPLGEEQRKLYFEAFKHLTTLNAAVTLVLLAIYREGAIASMLQVLVPIVGFGISLLLSLSGMYQTTAKEDFEARGHRIHLSDYAHLTWALYAFALGVGGALLVEVWQSILDLTT